MVDAQNGDGWPMPVLRVLSVKKFGGKALEIRWTGLKALLLTIAGAPDCKVEQCEDQELAYPSNQRLEDKKV